MQPAFDSAAAKFNAIVDLPTPLGPSKPQISPSRILRDTSSRICLLLYESEIFFSVILRNVDIFILFILMPNTFF